MSSFPARELSLALSELGWGLQSWEILSSPGTALLSLLEPGQTVSVQVSEKGWRVLLPSSDGKARTFETLDALLGNVSPMFEARRIKLLYASLESISARRDWDEGEEYVE